MKIRVSSLVNDVKNVEETISAAEEFLKGDTDGSYNTSASFLCSVINQLGDYRNVMLNREVELDN